MPYSYQINPWLTRIEIQKEEEIIEAPR